MKDSPILKLSVDFSVAVIGYYKWLTTEKKEFIMSKQLLRSATSIGANVHEAYYAASRADFVSKMSIALKEAAETEYWFIILKRTDFYDKRFDDLSVKCTSLIKMITASINTAKKSL